MNEKQRAEFEKWYKENINQDGPFLGCKEAFRSEHAAISAKAWKAAIASVVVELPCWSEYDTPRQAIEACADRIKDSGVKHNDE